MSVYDFLSAPSHDPALVDAATGEVWTYRQLADAAKEVASRLRSPRRELVFAFCAIDRASVVGYLGAIASGHAVALLEVGLGEELQRDLIERYRPRFLVRPGEPPQCEELRGPNPQPHDDLRVLLSTSGSTGSPKLVRLSDANVTANAASIVEYLEIGADERAIASLPIHYSYGLSVLHSHLLAGASIAISAHSVIRPEFWSDFAAVGCTSFAGVPYSYAMLQRTGFQRHKLPTLRTMTQAGGPMSPEMIVAFHEHLSERGARLVVMYGQTEATARIAYVPPRTLPEKAGTIGIAIPRGRLSVVGADGEPLPRGEIGELLYEGPNVMLGYAEGPDDIGLDDLLGGKLSTGDLGYVDADGFHVITGRSKRFAKVFGLRVNLDEVETFARSTEGPTAVVGADDRIVVFCVGRHGDQDVGRALARHFNLNVRAFDVRHVDALPLLGSGKVDYETLGSLADAG